MSTAAAGLLVGPWELEGEIGRGGQAVVHRARHATLGRPAAVKLVRRSVWGDPAFRTRFERECDVLATLAHPHIIPVYDAGESAGRGYLAMRLAEGGSLADRLRDGALDPRRAIALLGAIAGALDAVHDAGRVHRDVTPANILLDPGAGPWLGDFGLARRIDATVATQEGLLIGTAGYLAPEVIAGGRADPASDRYALAAVAFHALTGRPPYQAPDIAGILYGHLHGAPSPVGAVAPHLPPALDAAFARGLARRPADRPARARELVEELARACRGRAPRPAPTAVLPSPTAVMAPAPTAATAVAARPRRGRVARAAATVAIVGIAAAVGAGGALTYTMRDSLPFLAEAPEVAPVATTIPGPDGIEIAAGAVMPGDLPEGVTAASGAIAATAGDVRVVSLPGGTAALDPVLVALGQRGLSTSDVAIDGRAIGTIAMMRWGFFVGGSAWGLIGIREPSGERGLVVSGDRHAVEAYMERLGASIGARILPAP